MTDMDKAEFNYSSQEDASEEEELDEEDKENQPEGEAKSYQSYDQIASSKDFEKMTLGSA